MAATKERPNLPDDARNVVAQWLLQNSHSGRLRYGAQQEASLLFHISVRTVRRIWKVASQQKNLGKPVNVVNMKKGCPHGTKKVLDEAKIRTLSVLERSSIRKLAGNLGVSVGTVHNWIKQKKVRPHTNAIKPYLTDANKFARLKWSLSMLTCISANGKIVFQPMYNIIHVDEKFFNLTRTSQRYYLLTDEKEPHRTCKSKSYIGKIMFICVVSIPQQDMEGNLIFDGKFGIFPFIIQEPATRNSKNRPKGTMITKPIPSINKFVMKDNFIEHVTLFMVLTIRMFSHSSFSLGHHYCKMQIVPCIKQKWPEGASKDIIIQQDNAKPHINNNDPDFQAAAQSDGFNIKLVCQPPNSPDSNVNDLRFFRSIQSLKDQKNATTVDDLIKNVTEAFDEYPVYKLNDVFLTLQGCLHEIMKVNGENNYKIPHMAKDRLRREGTLPECIEVEEQLVKDSLEYLNLQGSEELANYSLESLVNGIDQVNLGE